MANQDRSRSFHSVAEQMLEAIEKASKELSQTANKSVEQLGQYSINLQNLFTEQLRQASNQQQVSVGQEFRALSQHKEKCLNELSLFERAQIETVIATGHQVRESLDRHAQQCQEKFVEMFKTQPVQLKELVTKPANSISEQAQEHTTNMKATAIKGKAQIEAASTNSEELLSSTIEEYEDKIQKLIDEGKQLIYDTVDNAQKELQDKATSMRDVLDTFFQESSDELDKLLAHQDPALTPGCLKEEVQHAVSASSLVAQSTFTAWNNSVNQLNDSFAQALKDCLIKHKETHQGELDSRLKEAKEEIIRLSLGSQAQARLTHQALHRRLEELTQEHEQRLEALLLEFENLLFALRRQSGEIASREEKIARDLKEKLKIKLASAGAELTASLAKLAEHLETEYVKASQQADQTLESLSLQVTESLDKQVQVLKNELKRISKTFQDELDDLESQVEEIEVAGAKASEMVMTYKSAFLSLE